MILSQQVTPAEIAAALNRIAAVADPEDVNMVRAELARLRLVLDSGEDDDVDYKASWTGREDVSTWYSFSYPGTTRGADE